MKNPFLAELSFYLKGAYPAFVYQKNPNPIKDYIPVFISHSITEREFEDKLKFIKENSYKTVTVSELYSFINGDFKLIQPTICLTFDDGHESLYKTAYPLLKKYNLTATAFIVPSFIGNSKWISWREAKEISDQGVIELQSHTLSHNRIFIDNKIAAHNKAGFFKNELGLDKPTIIVNGNNTTDIPLGHPVYTMDSRMSDKPRYLENGKWETKDEQKNAILKDLIKSREIIEEKIDKPVKHLAYPWGIGSKLSQELSKEAGYLSNFYGPISGLAYNRVGCNPYTLTRIKDDYIFRLPGKNRCSLTKIFSNKFMRRKKAKKTGRDIY